MLRQRRPKGIMEPLQAVPSGGAALNEVPDTAHPYIATLGDRLLVRSDWVWVLEVGRCEQWKSSLLVYTTEYTGYRPAKQLLTAKGRETMP